MNINRPSFEDSFGGTYLLVEPGSFNIGDEVGSGHPNEQPVAPVEISEPFFLGVRPVTQAHWSAVMNNNPSKFQEGWSAGLRPVETISFDDVHVFIKRLNNEQQEYIGFKGHWRLPSESEWEYVSKAGTNTRWSFGNKDSELDAHGWHAGNSGATTREVGSKKANPCLSQDCRDQLCSSEVSGFACTILLPALHYDVNYYNPTGMILVTQIHSKQQTGRALGCKQMKKYPAMT